ncbi:MAG: ribonuclease Z [Peptococcaceae bacterium]|nr:ribonuclease Z [Peptococcaceae bacterium]
MLDICLLGCGGMLPLPKRFLTSLLIRHQGKQTLIDCGESTQVALHLCGWSTKHIDNILITHFHGDHVIGLPGMLMTMGNQGRTEPVHIYGGVGLTKIIEGLMVVCQQLPFELVCHEILPEETFKAGELEVTAIAVEHRVPCLAYSLYLPRQGKFDVARAKAKQIPQQFWSRLQQGQTVEWEDKVFVPEDVLGKARQGLKITYSTDCRPSSRLVELVKDSDLYVAEGLYGDEEKKAGAAEKGHMVFSEAAQIAQEAQAKEMWLTHYSPAMLDPEEFLEQTRLIFPQTFCGDNLLTKTFKFVEE